jgi:hypothetical protein
MLTLYLYFKNNKEYSNVLMFQIYNTDHQKIMKRLNMVNNTHKSFEDFVQNARMSGLVNNFVSFQPSVVPPLPEAG